MPVKTPMRFAMKFGRVLAVDDALAEQHVPRALDLLHRGGSVSGPATSSSSFMCPRVEEVRDEEAPLQSRSHPAVKSPWERPEVLEVTIAPGLSRGPIFP